MNIEKARNLLWEIAEDLTDDEVYDFISLCKKFAILVVDFSEEKAW